MKELLSLFGIVTVLNTPFTVDDRIDCVSLRKNVANALEAGVAGFLVPALASEVDSLSEDERILILETVLAEVGGRVPVIAGASASTREQRIHLTKAAVGLGCQGILVSIPYQDEQQYRTEVEAVAGLVPGFLVLQDWDPGGSGVPVPIIAKLFREIDAFRAYKIEVAAAGLKYTEVLKATEGRLHVSGGWAVTQMIEALDRGIHAFMPTAMHVIYTEIFSLHRSGARDAAQALFHQLLPVIAFTNQHLDISIHFFKRLLYKQGIYATDRVRGPRLPFDEYHQRIADELIERVEEIEVEILRRRAFHRGKGDAVMQAAVKG